MPKRTCAHKKGDGARCQATALKASKFCFFHDPEKAEAVQEARARGGKQRQQDLDDNQRELVLGCLPLDTADVTLETEDQVVKFLEQTANDVRKGRLDHNRAKAIASICSALLKAREQSDTDDRLKEVEKQLRPLQGLSTQQLLDIVKAGRERAVSAPADA